MSEHLNPAQDEIFKIEFGEDMIGIHEGNASLRRFDTGDGAHDHCLIRVDEENVWLFRPTPEQWAELLVIGVREWQEEEPDELSIELLADIQMTELQEFLDLR
jgi:hypothetical protein